MSNRLIGSVAAVAGLVALASSASAAPPDNTGNWTGKASQVGRSGTYTVTLTISKKGAESSYPDQKCSGKLTRAGGSGDYTFYTETITTGGIDPATKKGCPNGSITILRSGDTLIYGWIGAYGNKPIVVWATLTKQ